jgi:hypothetical protein
MNNQDKINQIVENATQMILSGVLLKNVKRHFTNLGLSIELSEKICKIAEFEANELQVNKAVEI